MDLIIDLMARSGMNGNYSEPPYKSAVHHYVLAGSTGRDSLVTLSIVDGSVRYFRALAKT